MEEKSKGNIINDLRLALVRKGAGGLVRDMLLHPGNQAIALYRLYRWLYLKGHLHLAFFGARLNYFLCGVDIHPDADIGPDFHLDHPQGVLIGRRTRIGKGVRIYSKVSVGAVGLPEENPFLEIKDYVQIVHGAQVGGSCTVGEYAVIAANVVNVDRDVPPYATVVGSMGRIVKIAGERVNPDDYKAYKYDPADFHGPPPEHDLSKEAQRREGSWLDPKMYGEGGKGK
jgi:serine O-acetyltransferase